MVVGIEVIVTCSVDTELDGANGTRGHVVDYSRSKGTAPAKIRRGTQENPVGVATEYILVKLYRRKAQ